MSIVESLGMAALHTTNRNHRQQNSFSHLWCTREIKGSFLDIWTFTTMRILAPVPPILPGIFLSIQGGTAWASSDCCSSQYWATTSLVQHLQATETARQMILLLSRRNAKLSFFLTDTIRINYNHSLSVINDHIIWMADRRRYPPQQTSNVTNGSNSVLLPHVYIKQSAETLQRVQYVTTTAYYFTHSVIS